MSQEKLTYTPTEFAQLFGKSISWAYRQLYSGRVEAITHVGRILIPAEEVEKILKSAGRYLGMTAKKAAIKATRTSLPKEQGPKLPAGRKERFKSWIKKRRYSGQKQPRSKPRTSHWRGNKKT